MVQQHTGYLDIVLKSYRHLKLQKMSKLSTLPVAKLQKCSDFRAGYCQNYVQHSHATAHTITPHPSAQPYLILGLSLKFFRKKMAPKLEKVKFLLTEQNSPDTGFSLDFFNSIGTLLLQLSP